jgi:hypothetical protein
LIVENSILIALHTAVNCTWVNTKTIGDQMEYKLYHDESKEGGYWHGMLLVPKMHQERMYGELMAMRSSAKHDAPLGIKCIRSASSRIGRLGVNWLQYGIAAMATKTKSPVRYRVGFDDYREINEPIGAKFILFRKDGLHQDMTYLPDDVSRIETTTRMGLKGGLHALFGATDTVHISRMHFDGHEHYTRHLDRERIIGRMRGLRDYCTISTSPGLIVDGSSDHTRDGCQEHIDCQFLQLTDLLVGSFRTLLGSSTNPEHQKLARPVMELLNRYNEGPARMRHSRWHGSFWMSQCKLVDGHWSFDGLKYKSASTLKAEQLGLDFPESPTASAGSHVADPALHELE